MEFEIREAKPEDLKTVGDLFAAHLQEQISMDPYPVPNPAFDPHLFIEAMMNPKVNQIFLAVVDDNIIGFARLGILYGEGLIPLGAPPKRTESSYLKRLPVIVLNKLRSILDRLISKFEERRTIGQMGLATKRGYIADMYIVPDMRRKGVGDALLKASLQWFKSMGLLVTDLQYLWANEVGKTFWLSKGFTNYRTSARIIISDGLSKFVDYSG